MSERTGAILVHWHYHRPSFSEFGGVDDALGMAICIDDSGDGSTSAIIDYSTEPPTVLQDDDFDAATAAKRRRMESAAAERPKSKYKGPLWRVTILFPTEVAGKTSYSVEARSGEEVAKLVARFGDWATVEQVQ